MVVARPRAVCFCFGPGKFVHDSTKCTALVNIVVLQSCYWLVNIFDKMLLQCFDCELKNASSCIIILGVCCSQVLDRKSQEVEP